MTNKPIRGNGEMRGERGTKHEIYEACLFSLSPISPFLLKGFKALSRYDLSWLFGA
jgi:hypothetical protein